MRKITKFLACGTSAFGYRRYHCDKPGCSHKKYLHQTCKSRASLSCGVKATERWIIQQTHILPACEWKHITLTLPHTLWAVFQHNSWLLNDLFTCTAEVFLGWEEAQDINIGVFCTLHTYGRRLNWNVHLHLSVTRCGLFKKQGGWKPVAFKAKPTELCWRTAVIHLLRRHYAKLKHPMQTVPDAPGYAAMRKGYVKVDPYACVLCSGRMAYTEFRSGSTVSELILQTKQQVNRRPA